MNNTDWVLIAVVIIAFIVGYSMVGFVIKKMKTKEQTGSTSDGQSYKTQQEKSKSATWESVNEEEKYRNVLGLKSVFTVQDVKQAYHKLLSKYHPDKVNHLGDEFKRIAQVRTREINEAYEYFKKKYNIK